MRQADRSIDWLGGTTAMILRKIRAADSAPGVLGTLLGKTCFLYGAHVEERPPRPARQGSGPSRWRDLHRHGRWRPLDLPSEGQEPRAVPVAGIELTATQVLGSLLRGVPEVPLPIDAPADHRTFREIVYAEEDGVGYLTLDFYKGAMSTSQCYRLRDAFLHARSRPTKVIVLLGGRDFWSNGIHLNEIEASADPAAESWRNINAIDDLIFEILNTMSHLVIAGLRGNAGAGGAMLALAADRVYARSGVVLNPTTGAWVIFTARNIGPIRCRGGWGIAGHGS
jgi:putative two-component system hydrogenase maturation factor HypX/HoxX